MSRASRLSTPRFSKLKQPVQLTNIPFPEWVDNEVNQEKWDVRAIKDAKRSSANKKLPVNRLSTTSEIHMENDFFIDLHTFRLPNSIKVAAWKRPNELYEDVEFVISKPYIDFTSLRECSFHIMHSQFVRSFLNSISILDYISATRPWDIESVNNNFTPNTDGVDWKPWHHVYSLCGAGKGQAHAPKYNPAGKYVVRLHWLGCWRKIYVDDRLPIDENDNILLPGYKCIKEEPVRTTPSTFLDKSIETMDKKSIESGSSKSSKKSSKSSKSSKASQMKKSEPPPMKAQIELWPYILSKALMKIASLTWTDEKEIVDFNPISCLTGWICQKIITLEMHTNDIWDICDSYTPDFEWAEEADARAKTAKSDKKGEGKKKGSISKEGKKSKKGEIGVPIQEVIDETKVYCLVGSCKNIKNFIKELDNENIQEGWNQDFLIEASRDKPLIKPEPKPELARWKRFRWLNWAISKGLWPADDPSTPIKCLKFYNNFKKTDPPVLKSGGKEDNQKKNKKSSTPKGKGSKGSQASSKQGALKIFPLVDRSVWVDFADVENHIDTLYIFFRPSQFLGRAQVSNCCLHDQGKDKSKKIEDKSQIELKWSMSIKDSRNEPAYLLLDSLEEKLLVINLCQSGHVDRLMYPILAAHVPYANVILEDYNWQRNRVGPIHVFLRTIGSKTVLLYLPPGRIACKLWIWCNGDYVLDILCNVPIIIGSIDAIVDAMSLESLLLGKFAQEVGTAFGNLVQAFGTSTFLDEMRKFYRIFANDLCLNKVEYREIYNQFMNILLKIRNDKNEAFALKVLFMDPNISYKGYRNKDLHVYNYSVLEQDTDSQISHNTIGEIKMQERAAVKIQSVMKSINIRKLLDCHRQTNKKYYEVYESLKKIYFDLFSDTKRASCIKLLKQFYLNCNGLKTSYLYNELLNVVDIKTYKGTVSTSNNANTAGNWIFITRQRFINKSSEPLMMRALLLVNLTKYIVRVFDNDDLHEVPRLNCNTKGYFYPPNQRGFTITCYGWTTDASTKINWKLYLIYLKGVTPGFVTTEEPIDIKTLSFCYRPNVQANVCKCKLQIHQTANVTLRLSTSGSQAELELLVLDSQNSVLAKIQGKQNVILPLIRLKCDDNEEMGHDFSVPELRKSLKSAAKNLSKTKVPKPAPPGAGNLYYVEGSVLNKSWPLTKQEWLTVKVERNKYLLKPSSALSPRSSLTENKKRISPVLADLHPITESPYWTLQVIHDIGQNLSLERDLSRQDEINNIKIYWYHNDLQRYDRSQQIRQEYLQNLVEQGYQSSDYSCTVIPKTDSDITLNRWIPETMMLKPFDLSEYYIRIEEEPIYLSDLADWESSLIAKSGEEIKTLAHTITQCQERMDRVENDQIENFIIMREWYDECRADSAELIKSSYALRDQFIDMILEQSQKPRESLPKVEKKKDKKKKK